MRFQKCTFFTYLFVLTLLPCMQKYISSIEPYAPSVLRFGIAAVILWFGTQQLMHPDAWTAYVPVSVVTITHMSALTIVHLNALFELFFGFLLVIGWRVRIVALLLALHLLDIMWVVGYGEIGVRDFGLAIATLAICMHGPDPLSVDKR